MYWTLGFLSSSLSSSLAFVIFYRPLFPVMNYAWPSLIACFQNRQFKGNQLVDRYRLANRLTLLRQYLEHNKLYIYGHYSEIY